MISAIEHVGSTSVVGLASKPVIDIDIVVQEISNLDAVIRILRELGYAHLGDRGISGRESFELDEPDLMSIGLSQGLPAHNLYVCKADSLSLRNHLTVRRYLRKHPTSAQAYAELKRKLAEVNPFDVPLYVQNKTSLIVSFLKAEGFSAAEIQQITSENLRPASACPEGRGTS